MNDRKGNWQARAKAFRVGDRVYPVLGGTNAVGGVVVAVWPAIGMVDVALPYGTSRYPVEELYIDTSGNRLSDADIQTDMVPGGLPTVPVSGGPPAPDPDLAGVAVGVPRVASASKVAIYWIAQDRKFRATREEVAARSLCCPRCDYALAPTVYKRENGKSVRLLGCKKCLFLVKPGDVEGWEG